MTRDDFMCSTRNPLFPFWSSDGPRRRQNCGNTYPLVCSSAVDKRSSCLQYSGLGKDGLDVDTRQHFKVTVAKSPLHALTGS